MAATGARVVQGAAVIAELVGLPEKVRWSDLAILGEGSLDEQSMAGKAPVYVAREARTAGRRVLAVAGQCSGEFGSLFEHVEVLGERGMTEPRESASAAGSALAEWLGEADAPARCNPT
jgi:glycerate kinase